MIAVLFAKADSNYKNIPGVDVWDAERDARSWPGGTPVVAHPPCRGWGKFRMRAKPRKGERALAIFAVRQVRKWGGCWNTLSDQVSGNVPGSLPLARGIGSAASH